MTLELAVYIVGAVTAVVLFGSGILVMLWAVLMAIETGPSWRRVGEGVLGWLLLCAGVLFGAFLGMVA